MIPVLLKQKDTAHPEQVRHPRSHDDSSVAPMRRIRCRHCRESIADHDPESTRHVFVNPAGRVFEILRVRDARLDAWGVPTEEHTWFAGFAWRVGTCPGCGFHLGWIFDAVEKANRFYGLITSEVEES